MHLDPVIIENNFRIIPYIADGKENTALDKNDLDLCRSSILLMQEESKKDRLYRNYTEHLNLDKMYIYTLLWDTNSHRPVMFSGAQCMTENCCRIFSRYYLFNDYRTKHTDNLYAKVDDFKVDQFHLINCKDKYPFIFWSRDKGTGFFKRLKNARPDLFSTWEVYPDTVEILWKDNVQGIMYTNTNNPDLYIKELLFNK